MLFDQRGCGKSTPSASDDDATPALTDNTTQHLIDDVSALRHELNINGKMHVFGGSWGSDLPPEKWTPGYAALASACCGVM